jgi:hypothetical protein
LTHRYLLACRAVCWALIAISAIDSFLVDTSRKAGFVHCFFHEDSKGIQRNNLTRRDIQTSLILRNIHLSTSFPKSKRSLTGTTHREQDFLEVRRLRFYYFFISLYRVWKLGLQE